MEIMGREPSEKELDTLLINCKRDGQILHWLMRQRYPSEIFRGKLDDFIKAAYQLFLKRDPSIDELIDYRVKLAFGELNEFSFLERLMSSEDFAKKIASKQLLKRMKVSVKPYSKSYKTTIVIATPDIYGEKFRRCYDHLRKYTHPNYRLIIAVTHFEGEDYNHPQDMNIAFKGSDTPFYVLMNDDIYVQEGWLDALIETALQDERIGIVGGLFFYPDGRIQHAGGKIACYDPNRIDQVVAEHRFYQLWPIDAENAFKQMDVPFVTGALMLVKRECMRDIGMWDENLKLSWNDVEYCFRAWFKGWRVVYTPKCRAIHDEGATIRTLHREGWKSMKHYHEAWRYLRNRWRREDIERLLRMVEESNLKHYGLRIKLTLPP